MLNQTHPSIRPKYSYEWTKQAYNWSELTSNDYQWLPMTTSNDYPMTLRWLSNDYPMTIQWLSKDYPMTSTKFWSILLMIISACDPGFWIWDFALASRYKGEIWDLCTKLGLFLGPKFRTLIVNVSIFIGPESDHWLCLSLTHWLTDSLTDSLLFSKLDACENCCVDPSPIIGYACHSLPP